MYNCSLVWTDVHIIGKLQKNSHECTGKGESGPRGVVRGSLGGKRCRRSLLFLELGKQDLSKWTEWGRVVKAQGICIKVFVVEMCRLLFRRSKETICPRGKVKL